MEVVAVGLTKVDGRVRTAVAAGPAERVDCGDGERERKG
jgi:hypothetical protein